MTQDRKRCSLCLRVLDVEAFHRDRSRHDGRDPRCKLCRSGERACYPSRQTSYRSAAVKASRRSLCRSCGEPLGDPRRAWCQRCYRARGASVQP